MKLLQKQVDAEVIYPKLENILATGGGTLSSLSVVATLDVFDFRRQNDSWLKYQISESWSGYLASSSSDRAALRQVC